MFGLPPLPPHFQRRAARRGRQASRVAHGRRRAPGSRRRRRGACARPSTGLARLATDVHAGVRATAFAALGLLGERRASSSWCSLDLHDPFPEVREFAALAPRQIGGERALRRCGDALRTRAAEVRFQAAAALAELDPEHAAPRPAAAARPIRTHEVRAQAVLGAARARRAAPGGPPGAARSKTPRQRPARSRAGARQPSATRAASASLLARARARRSASPEVADALARLGCQVTRGEPLARIARRWLALARRCARSAARGPGAARRPARRARPCGVCSTACARTRAATRWSWRASSELTELRPTWRGSPHARAAPT